MQTLSGMIPQDFSIIGSILFPNFLYVPYSLFHNISLFQRWKRPQLGNHFRIETRESFCDKTIPFSRSSKLKIENVGELFLTQNVMGVIHLLFPGILGKSGNPKTKSGHSFENTIDISRWKKLKA